MKWLESTLESYWTKLLLKSWSLDLSSSWVRCKADMIEAFQKHLEVKGQSQDPTACFLVKPAGTVWSRSFLCLEVHKEIIKIYKDRFSCCFCPGIYVTVRSKLLNWHNFFRPATSRAAAGDLSGSSVPHFPSGIMLDQWTNVGPVLRWIWQGHQTLCMTSPGCGKCNAQASAGEEFWGRWCNTWSTMQWYARECADMFR
jgi:hypothetical protein